jgi:hypothetical protein
MLAEGKPELSEGTLVNGIRTLQGPISGLEDIVRRGVIHKQGTGTMAFFHQTFFEHSAARGMLARYANRFDRGGDGGHKTVFRVTFEAKRNS